MEKAICQASVAVPMSSELSLGAENGLCWQTARSQVPLSYSHKKINYSNDLSVLAIFITFGDPIAFQSLFYY